MKDPLLHYTTILQYKIPTKLDRRQAVAVASLSTTYVFNYYIANR